MVAFGERGTLEWDYLTAVTRLSLTGKPIQEFVSTQPADEMYLAQDLAFINGCSGTLDHRQTSCEEGVRALLVIEAAQRASGLHHEIEIDSI